MVLYPNPARSLVTLQYEATAGSNSLIRFQDITGRVMLEFEARSEITGDQTLDLDISALSSGLYVVTVADAQGVSFARLEVIEP